MYLLDTNVVSEMRKISARRADRSVTAWSNSVAAPEMYVSAVTIEELETGVLGIERWDAAQGELFRRWMEDQVLTVFEGRVLPIDTRVVRKSAGLHVPDRRPVCDGFIAATALVHGLILVTRNAEVFEPMGVKFVNPWESNAE